MKTFLISCTENLNIKKYGFIDEERMKAEEKIVQEGTLTDL